MKAIGQFLAGAVGWVAVQSGLVNILPHGVQVAIAAVSGVLGVLGIRHAATSPAPVVDWLNGLGRGWKTLTGVLVACVGAVLAPDVLGTLPGGLAHTLQTLGVVLTAVGLYHAQTQAP